MITGEQHPLLLQEEAQVVGRVPRGVQSPQHELRRLDQIALAERSIDGQPIARVERHHLGTGALLEAGDAGGVVAMRVRAGDPADAVAAAPGDGIEVGGVVGPGIDHHDLVDPHQVGVRARTGHRTRIVGHDAPHERAQGAGHASDEGGTRFGLGVGHGIGHEVPAPACTGRGAASSASVVAKRPRSARLRIVGPMSGNDPA